MAKRTTKKKNTATVAAYECRTDPILLESWVSKVGGSGDGRYLIDEEDSLGYFNGLHLPSAERIFGRCSGNGIWFVRPADDPIYMFKGKFAGAKKLKGKRNGISMTLRKQAVPKTLAADDWEADKIT